MAFLVAHAYALLAYLTLFCPAYTAVGIYNNLE